MKPTEQDSHYDHLEDMPVGAILRAMNAEDKSVPLALERALPQLERLIECAAERLAAGGRLFYMGSGTSGRLGVVDASECPPTFGVPYNLVIGLIAGGDGAIRKAVEQAEDNALQGWNDLKVWDVTEADFVVGLSASGTTPYVLGALSEARRRGVPTGCIVCNPGSPIAAAAEYPVEIITGPEFLTGSTRLKAGTAQKLALNMISTACMIRLGRVQGNKMVDMRLSNAKLRERGARYVMAATGLDYAAAESLLLEAGSVREAVARFNQG